MVEHLNLRPNFPKFLDLLCEICLAEGGRANWGTQKLETFGGEGLEVPQLVGDQAERIPDFGFACVQKHAFQRAFGVDEAEGLNDVPLATGNNAVVEVPRVSHEVRASVSDCLKEGMDRETKEKRA